MSPLIDLPIYLSNLTEIRGFLEDLEIQYTNFELIIPSVSKDIWRVTVDFKYRKQLRIFVEKFWGKDYFEKYIDKK